MSQDDMSHFHKGLSRLAVKLAGGLVKYAREIEVSRRQGDDPVASDFDPSTWPFNIRFCGYGFGGALAEIVAVKFEQAGSVTFQLHLTTFGSPAVANPELGTRLVSIRRFAHARDPITRLIDGFEHLGKAIDEDETRVEIDFLGSSIKFGASRKSACEDMGCHTAYAWDGTACVDFRDPKLMVFYSKVSRIFALMMLPGLEVKSWEELWTHTYTKSKMLTAEGDVPCPWSMRLQTP
jgi:hypothetical protein